MPKVCATRCATSRTSFEVQAKIDGLTMTLLYRNGKLIQAATRGDGSIGEIITDNALTIQNVPHELDFSVLPENVKPDNMLYIRTEVCMHVDEFERVNKEQVENGKKPFANPRNCAAGSLRTLDPEVTRSRKLDAIAFTILDAKGFERLPDYMRPHMSERSDLNLLFKLGFHTVWSCTAFCMDGIKDLIEQISTDRKDLPYWIDGADIKSNDKDVQSYIGDTNK